MAGFSDCIRSAQKQGVLTEEQADTLIDRYEQHRQGKRQAGDSDPETAARSALTSELEAEAARKKNLAALAEKNRDDIKAYLETYKTASGKSDVYEATLNKLENFGYGAATSSLAGTAQAKYRLALGELSDLVSTFRRSRLTGRRFNKPAAENVAREAFGEATGSPEAKAMADAVGQVNERQRLEYNALGGNIGKLDRYLPQFHNPAAVLRAGFDKWSEYIKPKLDLERMKDPLTGEALTPERLDATLRSAWEHITTGGWSDREPSSRPFGLGSTANQRQEHRFLHFKSADDWLAYNRDFGHGDPIQAIFQHIKGMSDDIAAMEILGPNPAATVEWLKQTVQSEAAKSIAGKPTLHAGGVGTKLQDAMSWQPKRIQAVWDYLQGREVASKRIATGFGDIRNLATSAQLGGASILASLQDPFIDMAARKMSGLPQMKAMMDIATALSKGKRENAVRAGLGVDDFVHIMGSQARYAGDLGGGELTRWLADRTVNLNGLEPITQSRKHAFGLDFAGAMADRRDLSFSELQNANPFLHRTMEDYGLGEKDWNKLRAVDPFEPAPGSAGLLRPTDVAQNDRRLAERYLEMILGQTERAVPTGTARSRAFATQAAVKGTVVGELALSALQYKTFTLSFMGSQLQQIMQSVRGNSASGVGLAVAAMTVRGAGYAFSLGIPMTLAGGLALQLKNISNGRDLEAIDGAFMLKAFQYGGGSGVIGDFLLSDVSRFGHGLAETLAGPTVGLMADIYDPAQKNLMKGMRAATGRQAEKITIGRDAVNFIGRYTPGLSSLFYTRAAYRRMFIDQLQFLADPEAHTHFRQQEQSLHRETGQGFFWRPGQTLPERAPVMSPAKQ